LAVATRSRDDLHRIIDSLDDTEIATARRFLTGLAQPENHAPEASVSESRTSRTSSRRPTAVVHAPPILNIDDLRGDFWPDDDDPEEFAVTIRRWRDEDVSDRLRR
jgi:hypothetical protein